MPPNDDDCTPRSETGELSDDPVRKTLVPNAKELAELLAVTNFSEQEIVEFYVNAMKYDKNRDGYMCFGDFTALCNDNGLHSEGLLRRLYAFMDHDGSGAIDVMEIVRAIGPLLRGKLEDVAAMMFQLYDLNTSGELTVKGMQLLHREMMALCDCQVSHMCINRRAAAEPLNTVISTGLSQKLLAPTSATSSQSLPSEHLNEIRDWVAEQEQRNGGKLDKEAFIKVICDLEQNENQKSKMSLLSISELAMCTAVLWFTVGGLWALMAVAALTERFEARHDIDESQIGTLNSVYFAAGIISPFISGYMMDHYTGPGEVTAAANTITTVGALVQWLANTPDLYPLLAVGRFLIGFGLESAFFSSIEVIGSVWPEHFGVIVGALGLQINVTVFLAFLLLPKLADSKSDTDLDSDGTDFALLIVVLLCVMSTIASYYVVLTVRATKKKADASREKKAITDTFAAFGRAVVPGDGEAAMWKTLSTLPLAYYLAILGNKAINYFFNTFSLFSSTVYISRANLSDSNAALATGLTSLIAGALAPVAGYMADHYGNRSKTLCIMSGTGVIAYVLLALVSGSGAVVWVATLLQGIMTAFSDQAVVTIPMIVGRSRAGVGYGVYGILGNLVDALVGYLVGVMVAGGESGEDAFIWFSVAMTVMGVLAWGGVYTLEGSRTFLETPIKDIVETKNDHLHLAALPFAHQHH